MLTTSFQESTSPATHSRTKPKRKASPRWPSEQATKSSAYPTTWSGTSTPTRSEAISEAGRHTNNTSHIPRNTLSSVLHNMRPAPSCFATKIYICPAFAEGDLLTCVKTRLIASRGRDYAVSECVGASIGGVCVGFINVHSV